MTVPHLLTEDALERSSVIANNAMNRERGLTGVNSYARDLGFDPVARLTSAGSGAPAWLDLCSGEGRALREALGALPGGAVLTGVDLVGPLAPLPVPAGLELVTGSVARWAPPRGRTYDLITCVHGLHYVGDPLGLLGRAAGWLAPGGLLIAHLDPEAIRFPDGAPAGRAAVAALRAAGFRYSARHHRVAFDGPGRAVTLPFRYLGADPGAGPNWTGQPAVGSHYAPAPVAEAEGAQ
ncbi:class I SAM-dependent methyltransferase [Streptomyces sp. H34-S4]|uniref:class I SAM-dependent methyltransferase n=1 Tax=Streptomyces sp. H34-S4 TaxID=2996463 RepID=UPI0022709DD0|nr:methyltransferase domain-containing protein [Streptomyces sp. H34-S4]MCY0934921.1 methyltransferase domain-containing protein [Streptomyces sp. H34-S4]